MLCPKCGSEIINGRCSNCGYIHQINMSPMQSSQPMQQNSAPTNDKLILILGILSFFVPILSIVVLVMAKDYNKMNDYGNSSDIKAGKICAKIALIFTIISIIFCILYFVVIIGFIGASSGYLDSIPAVTETMYAWQ